MLRKNRERRLRRGGRRRATVGGGGGGLWAALAAAGRAHAEPAGSASKVLSRLLHSAVMAGKFVRPETEIAKGAVSISSAAYELERSTAIGCSPCGHAPSIPESEGASAAGAPGSARAGWLRAGGR